MRYSQNNEETLILQYFGSRKGTVLDLGCNDGITLSNSRALILKGWNGVMVDASPSAFKKLRSVYPEGGPVECHNVAISDHDGWTTLHESGPHLSKNDTALLSSVIEEETARWKHNTEFRIVTVPCLTIKTLLSLSKFTTLEFISIDIEGMDLFVLEQMDLTTLGAQMVVVECNNRDPAPYLAHCLAHGLKYWTRTNENLIFIR